MIEMMEVQIVMTQKPSHTLPKLYWYMKT